MKTTDFFPDRIYSAALLHLPEMTPVRLQSVISLGRDFFRDVEEPSFYQHLWQSLQEGSHSQFCQKISQQFTNSSVVLRWCAVANKFSTQKLLEELEHRSIRVLAQGDENYPEVFCDQGIAPVPIILFKGSIPDLTSPRVSIVGTRNASSYGCSVAEEFGYGLAKAGVSVVSGLALGIDGAAQRGALEARGAPVIGVVGSGLDVVYPKRNEKLWHKIGENGLLLTEYGLGVAPQAWHFPARNRILAMLADIVIVVESHETGGSMHTVEEAQKRDRPIMAVPGPVRSSASRGTNQLLREGVDPVCDVEDILLRLGWTSASRRLRQKEKPELTVQQNQVLSLIGWEPCPIDQVLMLYELEFGMVAHSPKDMGSTKNRNNSDNISAIATILHQLEVLGVIRERGGWIERMHE